ncbi:arsenic resistance N-acetyltransferase ArsN2 [Mesorhizobium sp. VNQ89]|uniref:arsenic resistance N-acetyltransferase ArsN2 n=1 Tax=Mesorhizobium quangtriensis TaxID=3157709 RepID=UPI0032B77EE5
MKAERLSDVPDDMTAALLAAGLPVDDLAEDGRTFYRFLLDGQTVGFGGYERYGEAALLRSIVIAPGKRGAGLGRAFTEALMTDLSAQGVTDAYLLTTTASGFFQAVGFTETDRSSAPAAILATRQASALCPSTASLLSRSTKR